jgi:hypothetical protein
MIRKSGTAMQTRGNSKSGHKSLELYKNEEEWWKAHPPTSYYLQGYSFPPAFATQRPTSLSNIKINAHSVIL